MTENKLRIGIRRGFYNKNLKSAVEASGLNYTELREKTGIIEVTMSNIVNFKKNPTEEKRMKISIALEVPEQELFPEKYDELYDRISPLKREAEIEIDMLSLDSPELLKLNSGEDVVENAELSLLMHKLPQVLTEKEYRIIAMRNGFDDNCPLTYEEVAKEFSVTRERVRQIEQKALEKIRMSKVCSE